MRARGLLRPDVACPNVIAGVSYAVMTMSGTSVLPSAGAAKGSMSIDPAPSVVALAPVPELLARVRDELSWSFVPGRPIRVSRSPGRLDVMGGIADYTGSLVCQMPIDRAAAVATQSRGDRLIQAFSFNLLDANRPFTITMSLDDLANASIDQLRKNFNEPGRQWGGYLLGCLAILHEQKLVDLRDPAHTGLNLALLSTVPLGAGVSSSAAIEVATMMNLVDHFGLREQVDPMRVAVLCQQVENRVVGAPCGIMDQVASCAGVAGTLMRMVCQPHELLAPLPFPRGVRCVGLSSDVRHSVGGGQYGLTRCAAFMGHAILLDAIRDFAARSGRELISDPMRGYLANLDHNDYKRLLRPRLPETIRGSDFLAKYGATVDAATRVDADTEYRVQAATDHHVLEAHRVREFARHLEESDASDATPFARKLSLDKAGHLMYASHKSYGDNAGLGATECDLIVDLVRANESGGLYGARITGGGSGGTVAVLCDVGERADATLARIIAEYRDRTGKVAEQFEDFSPGGWASGTALV